MVVTTRSLTRSFVRGFVVSVLMMIVLTIVVRAQTTTQVPPAQDTAAADTLERAAQGAQGQSQMQPPGQRPSAAEAVRSARAESEVTWTGRFISLLGMFVMLGLGWLMSVNRRRVQWNVVLWGTILQVIFALIILKTPFGAAFFNAINNVIVALLGFTVEGARFLFGDLVWNNVPVGAGPEGSNAPMTPAAGQVARTGAFFAFNVLPTIIFFSSLMTVMYYMGVMQKVVKGMAWVMMRTMKTSGAETLSAAGNIFLGQTEAPLLIKPFVKTMTNSELFAVMTGGFATVAGGVMAAYVGMLLHLFPDIAGHLMAASVMSAPAGLVFAKMMYPETEEPLTRGSLKVEIENPDANVIDAAARGAGEGLQLALNVGAMLLAFIALIAVLNSIIGWGGNAINLTDFLQSRGMLDADEGLSLQAILGWLLAPLAWLMGVPWKDAPEIGTLLGIKTAVNEFIAYLQLTSMITEESLSPRSVVIATYALCGFANLSSIAIQIGGIGGLAPNRRGDLAKIGFRAMIAGTLASFMTANIAGALI
jgi:CNT family concentrative nucleoside transporter